MEIEESYGASFERLECYHSPREYSSAGSHLVWEDLTVVLPHLGKDAPKRLLNKLSGFAEPGRVLAIMGPSGSGKSTILDSLAGRLSSNFTMTGNVLLNGKSTSKDSRGISYVTQEDQCFLGTLTVRETITYSALLTLPTSLTKAEVSEVVDKAITEMGLNDCAEKRIGNWHTRGISTGEKKRLGISLEIITHPQVLLLDEPTSGLDSASAYFVVLALKSVADGGKMVIFSIHQPTSDVFGLFDDLVLLSDGEMVYFGESQMVVKFFADAKFPCPTRRNPSDHFLRCLNPGTEVSPNLVMSMKKGYAKATLLEKYKSLVYPMVVRRIQEIKSSEQPVIEPNKWSKPSWWMKLCTLTHRSFLNMSRDLGYYWLRIGFYVSLSISIGTIYYDLGRTNLTTLPVVACDDFIYGFMVLLSLGGLPSFNEELKVFYRERSNEQYGEAVFVISNFISSLPFLAVMALSSGTVIYCMVKLHSEFSRYAYFCINLFCCVALMDTCMVIIASMVSHLLMGIASAAGVFVTMSMATDIFRPLPELPKVFWRYPMSYIGFASWAIQGQYKNDMIGLKFEPLIPGEPKLKGETFLQTTFRMNLNHSKWWNLIAVMTLLFSYRALFFIVLKYKDRVFSFLGRQFGKRVLQHLHRKPSLTRQKFKTPYSYLVSSPMDPRIPEP